MGKQRKYPTLDWLTLISVFTSCQGQDMFIEGVCTRHPLQNSDRGALAICPEETIQQESPVLPPAHIPPHLLPTPTTRTEPQHLSPLWSFWGLLELILSASEGVMVVELSWPTRYARLQRIVAAGCPDCLDSLRRWTHLRAQPAGRLKQSG